MAGKVGHPKRPRSEAATFGRLVEAEREAGARTLGQARERVWKSDKKRWGSERKREDLWAEFKQIKQDEAAAAQLVEQMLAQLAAFERASAEQGRKFQAQIDAIEADFARKNPHLAGLNEKMVARLAAFKRDMAKVAQQADLAKDRIEAEFARMHPRAAGFLNRLRKPSK